MRLAIPEEIGASNETARIRNNAATVNFALTLMPLAGIAFLWFMGVVRAHLGRQEDQFFSTVFFGSGLLFLAMVFSCDLYHHQRLAIRMAGVFMLSLATIWARTRAMPRGFAIATYVLAITR